jgi:hypothetical protein
VGFSFFGFDPGKSVTRSAFNARHPALIGHSSQRGLERVQSVAPRSIIVWGGNVYVEERTVDVHIRRLRKALGEKFGAFVQTVRGTGYRFSTSI